MPKYFEIDGYFVDDNAEFSGYVVKDSHDVIESEDNSVFFYGLSEDDIKSAIKDQSPVEGEWVITSYREIDDGL